MPHGVKYGGRKAGTPNKRTEEARELLESMGVNPIERLANLGDFALMRGELDLARQCYATLAKYYAPQLRNVEVSDARRVGELINPVENAARFVKKMELEHGITDLEIDPEPGPE